MLLTFQDRLRIPWRGGAKQITLDNVLPIVVLISLQLLAAINFYCSLFVFALMPLLLLYLKRFLGKILPKSKFFILWFFWSGVYLITLFEFTVPLLEILPQENVAFVVLMNLSFVCLYKAKQRAAQGHVAPNERDLGSDCCKNGSDSQTAVLISDRDDSDDGSGTGTGGTSGTDGGKLACQLCRKYVPPRTYHCKVCASCVLKQDHHNVWLNCCIGKANHRLYVLGCLFTLLALLLFANLALTAVCHPIPIFTVYGVIVMMPDDCADIYFQYDIALCFTGSLYALLMALFIAISLLKQLCFISCGVTYTEWRRGEHINRRNCFWNWKTFCLGQ
ncbi:palmitoyltransferase ZDHHC23-B isoform X2 [Anopheles bellator]|nr:palmitoyltransferase ZDHHC23-B isoform X2 [Anopheles bellator]